MACDLNEIGPEPEVKILFFYKRRINRQVEKKIENKIRKPRTTTKKEEAYPGILSTSNSTPSLASTKISFIKGTGIPLGNRWGLRAMWSYVLFCLPVIRVSIIIALKEKQTPIIILLWMAIGWAEAFKCLIEPLFCNLMNSPSSKPNDFVLHLLPLVSSEIFRLSFGFYIYIYIF